ncbi:probable glutathione S-transferase [Cucurbita moschata]|uniref:glutathione transferase n=1 Tax=Cucurbita moschata TaxID=3662 RepID=A0A6J1E8K7_CUCMO|nr:probable glutathione S-transferase [Cucurbita moschata]
MGEELKLLVRTSSPYTLRIVWALKLKGLEYDTVYEDHSLANESSLLLEEINSPIHKNLPVLLIHGGKPIAEPLVILEYIDEVWKQNPLLPQDPYQRAVARFWIKFAEDKVLPSTKNAFVWGDTREEAIGKALENWKLLEEELKGKRFFGGESVGIVDIVVGWIAFSLTAMEEMVGPRLLVTQERFPLLSKWIAEFSSAPIIGENWPSVDQIRRRFYESHPLPQTQPQAEFHGYNYEHA